MEGKVAVQDNIDINNSNSSISGGATSSSNRAPSGSFEFASKELQASIASNISSNSSSNDTNNNEDLLTPASKNVQQVVADHLLAHTNNTVLLNSGNIGEVTNDSNDMERNGNGNAINNVNSNSVGTAKVVIKNDEIKISKLEESNVQHGINAALGEKSGGSKTMDSGNDDVVK